MTNFANLSPIELKSLTSINIAEIKHCKFEEILENSEKFPIKSPIDTGRLKTLKNKVPEEILTRNIKSVYPFVHERVLILFIRFLAFKKRHGSNIEKSFYKSMDLLDFVDRLLKRRAVMFMGKNDQYMLLSGEKGSNNWETIGTDQEKPPLILENCLSYDEIKLSAFLYVSSYTHFINKGDRKNMAVYSNNRSTIQDEGIIAGMIGPRLKKHHAMDFQEIAITAKQNKDSNGYNERRNNESIRKLFFDFYEMNPVLYEEAVQSVSTNSERFHQLRTPKGAIFDNEAYKKRLTIVFDCLLIEANRRATIANKTAFIHVVGLGLGVWCISDHQEKIYVDCFYDRLMALAGRLHNVSDVCLSYINQPSCGGYSHGTTIPISNHPLKGIKIHIDRRQPHEKLTDAGKLLVVSYAWDGNALPGNEFWSGKLGSSGDSAAASSTQITELHNPHINPLVCAQNLQVITRDGSIMALVEFLKKVSDENTPL